ncbi:unnamed protein product [Tetraodon nigroviridis]|uniref:(spotted green pufferfish) hypothetical protein n=1 Tax=Tetraodon nigroviridis TaxID=99883 RepID=Q4SV07_TETNG|nr:unnamed protein product [Tetraodon nigroviridis]
MSSREKTHTRLLVLWVFFLPAAECGHRSKTAGRRKLDTFCAADQTLPRDPEAILPRCCSPEAGWEGGSDEEEPCWDSKHEGFSVIKNQ